MKDPTVDQYARVRDLIPESFIAEYIARCWEDGDEEGFHGLAVAYIEHLHASLQIAYDELTMSRLAEFEAKVELRRLVRLEANSVPAETGSKI